MTTTTRTVPPDDRWRGLVGMYGGYVAGLFADAADDPDYRLASLAIRFLAAVDHGPMELTAAAAHRGRRTATTRLTLRQADRVRAEASTVSLRHNAVASTVRRMADPGDTPPAGYVNRPHAQGDLAFARNLDIRTPAAGGVEAGSRAWLRLHRPFRELGLRTPPAVACVLLDALLPALFAGDNPPAFVPTLEFGYVFTPAVSELDQQWCVGANDLDWLADGFCAEDASLHDSATGRLVARQRQLRTVRQRLDHVDHLDHGGRSS